MVIDLTDIVSLVKEEITINRSFNFSKDELKTTQIIDIINPLIIGNIKYINDEIVLNLTISGEMILPCSITLKEVNHPFMISIEKNISLNSDEDYKIINNTIDINPIIWENIVMEIPLKVTSPDALKSISGDGWRLIQEEE